MATTARNARISRSNNSENPNKNLCILEVTKMLGCASATKYLHTIDDMLRATRTKWKVRQAKTKYKVNGKTTIKDVVKSMEPGQGVIIYTKGHVLLKVVNKAGKVITVDTADCSDDTIVLNVFTVSSKTEV